MWQRIVPPACLVFLDVSLEVMRARAGGGDWPEEVLRTQQRRLAHARQHADLVVATDDLEPEQVLRRVLSFLQQRNLPVTGG